MWKKSVEVNFYAMYKMCVSRRVSSFGIVRYFNIPEKSINSRKDQVCHHKTYMFLLFATKKNEVCTCLGTWQGIYNNRVETNRNLPPLFVRVFFLISPFYVFFSFVSLRLVIYSRNCLGNDIGILQSDTLLVTNFTK